MSPASFKTGDLNFIPDEVIAGRRLAFQRKKENSFSFFILLAAILFSVGFLIFNRYQQGKLNNIEKSMTEKETQIAELRQFGEIGYALGMRLEQIQNIINKRYSFSILLAELENRTPERVEVKDFSVNTPNVMSLSAFSRANYTPIANFQDLLLAGQNDLGALFKSARIQSAAISRQNTGVDFSLEIGLNPEALYEQVK